MKNNTVIIVITLLFLMISVDGVAQSRPSESDMEIFKKWAEQQKKEKNQNPMGGFMQHMQGYDPNANCVKNELNYKTSIESGPGRYINIDIVCLYGFTYCDNNRT